jgi:hypothetical protein
MNTKFGYIVLILTALAVPPVWAQQPTVAPRSLQNINADDARRQQLLEHLNGLLQSGKLEMVAMPKQKLAATARPPLDPATSQVLQEQSEQTHREKTPGGTVPGIAPSTVGGARGTAAGSPGMASRPSQSGICMPSAGPGIASVSGKTKSAVFTPDPGTGQYPNNQYTIRGCNFGAAQGRGEIHIFGPFVNHNGPVKLAVDTWSGTLIVATLDPMFENEYDLNNITLVVVSSDGHSAQFAGNSFVATRASRPVIKVPKSAIRLGATSITDKVASPVSNAGLQAAGLYLPPQLLSSQSGHPWAAYVYQIEAIWHDYPPARMNWKDSFDFSKLRSGFTVDDSFQAVTVGRVMGSNTFGDETCKYYDTDVTGQLQGTALELTIAPQECDWSGKHAYGIFGLILSVTGPKGDRLNPWPDNVQ